MNRFLRSSRGLAASLALALVLAACGGDDDTGATGSADSVDETNEMTGDAGTEESEAATPLSYDDPVDLGDGIQLPESEPEAGTTPFDCDALDQDALADITESEIADVESRGFSPGFQFGPVDGGQLFQGALWADCTVSLVDDSSIDVALVELGDDFEVVKATVQEAMNAPVDGGGNVARFGALTTADGFFWESYGKYNLYLRVDDLALTIYFSPGETDPEIADLVAIAEFVLRTW